MKEHSGPLLHFSRLACLLSGFSALVFQSLWLRGFGLAYGGTAGSLSLVLAVFMAGLALGSHLARRWKPRDPLRAYASAEAGLGLSALAAQFLLPKLPGLLEVGVAQLGLGGGGLWLAKAGLCAALTLPSAACAGLTLPLLMEALERAGEGEHRSFGWLYAANTLGAALGALGAAFWLLPELGVMGAAGVAAAVNAGLAGLALVLGRAWPGLRGRLGAAPESGASGQARLAPLGKILGMPSRAAWVAGLSGAAALLLEVLWTRSLVLVLGSSAYAFAIMLGAVLLGIALGGLAYTKFEARIQDPKRVLAWGFGGLALLTLGINAAHGLLPGIYFDLMRKVQPSFGAYQWLGLGLAFFSLLPACVAQGFLFPLMLKLLPSEGGRRDSAALYVSNTVGAVAGALAAGFLVLPALGIQGATPLASLFYVMASLALFPSSSPSILALAAALVLTSLGVLHWRPWNGLVMTSGVYQYGVSMAPQLPKELSLAQALSGRYSLDYYEEGGEAVVAVRSDPAERTLLINGKADASLRSDAITQSLLAHLPLALMPQAKSALVIGWGSGGTAASALLHPLERLDAVEIEPAVWRAAALFHQVSDPRLHLKFEDARQELALDPRRYDVIISEPSNPWISGVANLFTAEFYALARRRLAPGGLFCQWFHFYGMAAEDLRRQLRTFAGAFPSVSLWVVPRKAGDAGLTGDIILLGGDAGPDLGARAFHTRLSDKAVAGDLLRADCCGPLDDQAAPVARDAWWLLSMRLLGDAELRSAAGQGPLNQDGRPRLEFSAPRNMFRGPREQVNANLALYYALEEAAGVQLPPLPAGLLPEAAERLGRHASERYQFARALRLLRLAESLGRRGPELDLALARALFSMRRPQDALAPMQRGLKARPQALGPWLALGRKYLETHRGDLALDLYSFLAQVRPGHAQVEEGLGLARQTLDR